MADQNEDDELNQLLADYETSKSLIPIRLRNDESIANFILEADLCVQALKKKALTLRINALMDEDAEGGCRRANLIFDVFICKTCDLPVAHLYSYKGIRMLAGLTQYCTFKQTIIDEDLGDCCICNNALELEDGSVALIKKDLRFWDGFFFKDLEVNTPPPTPPGSPPMQLDPPSLPPSPQ